MKSTNQRQSYGRKTNTSNGPLGSKSTKRKGSYCAKHSETKKVKGNPVSSIGSTSRGRNGYIPTNPKPLPMPTGKECISAHNYLGKNENKN